MNFSRCRRLLYSPYRIPLKKSHFPVAKETGNDDALKGGGWESHPHIRQSPNQ